MLAGCKMSWAVYRLGGRIATISIHLVDPSSLILHAHLEFASSQPNPPGDESYDASRMQVPSRWKTNGPATQVWYRGDRDRSVCSML